MGKWRELLQRVKWKWTAARYRCQEMEISRWVISYRNVIAIDVRVTVESGYSFIRIGKAISQENENSLESMDTFVVVSTDSRSPKKLQSTSNSNMQQRKDAHFAQAHEKRRQTHFVLFMNHDTYLLPGTKYYILVDVEEMLRVRECQRRNSKNVFFFVHSPKKIVRPMNGRRYFWIVKKRNEN